jgi:hypothetical protein
MSGPVVVLSEDEARRLTDEVKQDAAALWTKLLRLYEGQAHAALGYSSWAGYCANEFDIGKSQAYRLLDAGRVADTLAQSPIGERPELTESVARELVPLKDDPTAMVEVLDQAGEKPTAKSVRAAVTKQSAFEQRAQELREDKQAQEAATGSERLAAWRRESQADERELIRAFKTEMKEARSSLAQVFEHVRQARAFAASWSAEFDEFANVPGHAADTFDAYDTHLDYKTRQALKRFGESPYSLWMVWWELPDDIDIDDALTTLLDGVH